MTNLISISEPTFIKNLDRPALSQLQALLSLAGYDLAIDGKFGSQTERAFLDFKEDFKLSRPLEIGSTTTAKLIEILGDRDSQERESEIKPEQQEAIERKIQPARIDWGDWSCPISRWFTVGEACQWDRRRIPTDPQIQKNIQNQARHLDLIREAWAKEVGGGVGVTSWYRPPAINRAVGGASKSQHQWGGASDIKPLQGSIQQFEYFVDRAWFGALGYGAKKGFVHVDIRNGRGWKSGGDRGPRWNY